jgi:putative nucleotidyltransferase with HDIG domain
VQKVTINNIVPGAVVAKPIYNEDGVLIVPNGMILHEKGVKKLMDLGVHEAFIVYPESETSKILDLYEESPHIDDIIYQKTRVQAKKLIKKAMDKMLPEKSIDIYRISKTVDEIIDQLLSTKDIVLTLSRLRNIDDYTYEHCVNVCVVSLVIGMDMNLQAPEMKQLGTGALLHDVGKVYIPEEVLKKPSKLSPDEYNEVKSHTDIGYKILVKSGVSEEAAQIALFHHEKYDGSGYNRSLRGKEIPLLSRIVTIADSYDAMSNDRVYRKKLPPDKVYKEIASLSGCHFDYDIAERFLRRIDLFPIGTGVILNTKHKGVVVAENKLLPQSPVIRIFRDDSDPRNENVSTNYIDIDLSKTKYLFIIDTF